MRLSRDKVNVLARAVSDVLKAMDEVEFIEDPNTIRQETRKIIEDLLNQEAKIDQAARQKIDTQKRTILEGSQEWDILYRKYYGEEVKKLGVELFLSEHHSSRICTDQNLKTIDLRYSMKYAGFAPGNENLR